MSDPIWLSRQVVEILHLEQIAEHSGRRGLRDENALESALARPRQLYTYRRSAPLPRLAAALCIGIAKGHPFVDGNKRVALLATYTFLAINGLVLDADETETAETIEAVAAGHLGEAALAKWIAAHVRP
ncbi:MAG: type II toxin-antitoxin system death-on-curing family toxin [Candidatus Limnocylindria bacterium]